MFVKAYKTHPISLKDNLEQVLDAYLPPIQEGSIVVVSSKIISICEGNVIDKDKVSSKDSLVKSYADAYLLPLQENDPILAKKNNFLLPSAGIDESNTVGGYVLYPEDLFASTSRIWSFLKQRDKLSHLGVLVTDSHTVPLRKGILGFALSWCGFKPIYSYIGKPDCFGRTLEATEINLIDSLAVSAVLCMGEGNEQTPLAVISEAPKIEFVSHPPSIQEIESISINEDSDIYAPLLKTAPWVKKFPAQKMSG